MLLVAVALAPAGLLGARALATAIGAVVAVGVVGLAARWPDRALQGLVVVLALQLPVLALAYRLGVPGSVVRAAGSTKELLVVGVLVAATAAVVARRPRTDRLDRMTLAYVALVTLYLAVGVAGPRVGHDLFGRSPDSVFLQAVAFRSIVVAPALLLAVRSLRLDAPARRRILDTVVVVSGVVAAGAVVEAVVPAAWERVMGDGLGYVRYQRDLFGILLHDGVVVRTDVAGRLVVRAGSVLFDYLQVGFFLLPGLALAILRAARRATGWSIATAVLVGAGVLATVTRSAILAAAITLVALALTGGSAGTARRLRRSLVVAGVLTALLSVPTGLAPRLVSFAGGGDVSADAHLRSLREGVGQVVDAPWGIGLATTAETATRGATAGLVPENSYLDLAIQLGVPGVALFAVVLLLLVRELVRRVDADPLAGVALAVVVGLAGGALLLHVWTMIETTWLVFALAGLAVPRGADRGARTTPAPGTRPDGGGTEEEAWWTPSTTA